MNITDYVSIYKSGLKVNCFVSVTGGNKLDYTERKQVKLKKTEVECIKSHEMSGWMKCAIYENKTKLRVEEKEREEKR